MKKTTTTTAAVVSGDGIVTKSEGDDFDFDFDRWQAGGGSLRFLKLASPNTGLLCQ